MQITEQPKYEHDCDWCEFLGRYECEGQTYDLYACELWGTARTLIARYGNEGPDYYSGLSIAHKLAASDYSSEFLHPLAIAFQRYQDKYGIHGA